MKITSLEIKQHEFEKSFRGYNIEEVDIFLNNIANEWERTSNEAKMLRMQLEIAEKEAAKLREVEMSLIKTLQTAENTSNKITEHARIEAESEISKAKAQAESEINNAQNKAEQILNEAKEKAHRMVEDAQLKVTATQKNILEKEKTLKQDIANLETYKVNLISQLKALSNDTLGKLESYSEESKKSVEKEVPVKEISVTEEISAVELEKEIIEEEEVNAYASSANNLVLEEDVEEIEPVAPGQDLTIIEGIGSKIATILKENGIETYRDVITTPVYKIKDILKDGGSHFAMHDPSSWAQQAKLADAGKWEELEVLKEQLVGGRNVEGDIVTPVPEPKIEVKTKPEVEVKTEPEVEVETEAEAEVETESEKPSTPEQSNTEEMLDRVNKVKAALKKAMSSNSKENDESLTVKNVTEKATENSKSSGGSFFDNL